MRARVTGWMIWLCVSFAIPVGADRFAVGWAVASAQSGQESEQDRRVAAAREYMERGQDLYVQGRFIEAAEEFQRAYEQQPFGAFLYNTAVAYEQHGAYSQAADFFAQYLDREPTSSDAGEVRRRVERLRTRALDGAGGGGGEGPTTGPDAGGSDAGGLDPGGPDTGPDTGGTSQGGGPPPDPATAQSMKSLLSVRTNPDGAQITVRQNGRVVASGPAPYAQTLDVGEYELAVEHPDFRTVEEGIRVGPGRVYVVIVEMSQGQFLGLLRVVTDIPGAQVFVDDRAQGPVGQTPYANVIATGAHRIWIERPGYEPIERDIDVGLGEEMIVREDLARVDHGRISVVTNVSGARVFVDDRDMGTVPFEGDVPHGTRVVRVEADGMKDFETEVEVRQGQLTPVRARLRPSVGRAAAWITGTVAALFAGGGLVMGLLANGLLSDLETERDNGRVSTDDPRFTQGFALSIAADVAFGLAAILGLFSVYYFLRDPLPDSEGRVLEPRDWAFSPSLGPDGGRADFVWSF